MGKVTLNLEVDAELVEQARANGHDPLDLLLRGLRDAAQPARRWGLDRAYTPAEAERRAREWAEANKEAIAEHKRLAAERGLFADSARRW